MRKRLVLFLLSACVVLACTSKKEPQSQENNPPDYKIELETVRRGYSSPDTMWTQAYVGAIPTDSTSVLTVTMSNRLGKGIDNYGNLYAATSFDLGQTWTSPKLILERIPLDENLEQALSDVYPGWHAQTGRLLATGKLFIYDTRREEDPEIGRRAGYIVYGPNENKWSELKTFKTPEQDHSGSPILNPTFGCIQRYDLPDGDILLPMNYVREVAEGEEKNVTTVVHCSFDGQKLTYKDHGDELTIDSGRGLYEPSITKYNDEYFLTIRADGSAYVTKSKDGLHYQPIKEWTFDDGSVLGSYNTQQHWVTHSDGLYLVYTRRGANNDEIFRHRAPLFIARVDPENLSVIRETERILVPKRGARLGNFGIADVSQNLTVVSVAERMQENSTKYGADNSVFVSKILWQKPNGLISFK